MKKIRLDIGEMRVESFITEAVDAARGTVRAAEASLPATGCRACGGTARMSCFAGCTEEFC